jgi:tetratricopeptide (TPR) repeat protein
VANPKSLAEVVQPPPGFPALPWFFHQAARALGQGYHEAALWLVRRGLTADSEGANPADTAAARAALPELEQLACAASLAHVLSEEGETPPDPGLFANFVKLLERLPEGAALFAATRRSDRTAAWAVLNALAERPELPSDLAHHLAVIQTRCARAYEERGRTEIAEPFWRRAWTCWLRALGNASAVNSSLLVDWLLAEHRRCLNEQLVCGEVPRARCHWNLVQEAPARAATINQSLAEAVQERVSRFRGQLATDFLLTTREAMRYGNVPEGWRADYDKGLGFLSRLLSLDRDNVRLLTALVEICTELFLDLYNASDPVGLAERVERYTPFALQLARRIRERPGEAPARIALADFYKFRGFVARDRETARSLYCEALRLDPANENVSRLLAELEPRSPSAEE